MSTQTTVDRAGRIVIPKAMRAQLRLEPGDALEMEAAGEEITLRPVRGTGPLGKEQGIWVFHAGQAMSAARSEEMLQRIRAERDLANLGEGE